MFVQRGALHGSFVFLWRAIGPRFRDRLSTDEDLAATLAGMAFTPAILTDWRKLLPYPSVYLVQYLLGLAVVYAGVELLRWDERLMPVVVLVLTVPVNRWLIARGKGHAVVHRYH